MKRLWKVSEVARMAHVTVRTLHHYDEIGLLVPSERSASGYRLYDRSDLERLRQIVLLRELGFGLDSIRGVLDEPTIDRLAAMKAQRGELLEERRRTDAVLAALDRAIRALESDDDEKEEDMFAGFEAFDQAQYEDEVRERWGDTDAYRVSTKRAKSYTKADWARIREEGERPVATLAELMRAGAAPNGVEAMDAAEQARLHIERNFYPCPHGMHVSLAEMYESDERFAQYYESRAAGLRDYVVAAIRANAARARAS